MKDLNDFTLGIEVELDINARENHSGKAMENLLRNIFKRNFTFKEQVKLNQLQGIENLFGLDGKNLIL